MPRSAPHIVLGTAQLGLEYGAANRLGMPDESSAIAIVKAAIRSGIAEIDTARAYGDAERRIALALEGMAPVHVVTKLAPLDDSIDDSSRAVAAAAESLSSSRHALRQRTIQTLLLHRAGNRLDWDGAVWRFLLRERDRGAIRKLGISVQTPQEAFSAISDPDVTHIQMPYNLLDYRWTEVVDAIRSRTDIVTHVRSVLLQGLLTGQAHVRWPDVSGVDPDPVLASLDKMVRKLDRHDSVDLCLAYVRGQDWIDGIVIGMESLEQLERNLALFRMTPLLPRECEIVRSNIPRVPETLLDPAKWQFKLSKPE